MSKYDSAAVYLVGFALTVLLNMVIWNNIIVDELFTNLPKVTYWQSLCIYVLTNSLFDAKYLNDFSRKD